MVVLGSSFDQDLVVGCCFVLVRNSFLAFIMALNSGLYADRIAALRSSLFMLLFACRPLAVDSLVGLV